MSFPRALVLAIAAVLVPGTLSAALVLDQRQQAIDTSLGSLVVGGDSRQRLAQSVTVGLSGPLAEIRLPISCESGTLILQIVELSGGLPTGRVLHTEHVPASDLPLTTPPVFQAIEIRPRLPMRAGDVFAFVLGNPTGSCGLWRSETAEYVAGQGYFNDAVNDFRWISFKDFPEGTQDLSFETWIEVPGGGGRGRARLCEVVGFGEVPIPSFVPLCRCLEDASLREFRCAFLHPSFLLLRRIPLPLVPGQKIDVQWTLMPHEPVTQLIEVTDFLPGAPTLFFDARQIPLGETLTLGYGAAVPFDAKKLKLETEIGFGAQDGTMRTVLDADRP